MMRAVWSNDGAEAFAGACSHLDLHGATADQVEEFVSTLPMLTFYAGSEPIGALVLYDRSAHIGIVQKWRGRWLTRSVVATLKDALTHADHALIARNNTAARAFAARLGWQERGEEDGYVRYTPALH